MIPKFGPVELILILVIVTMLFGVGKLPEVFGSVGRGIREFRRNCRDSGNSFDSYNDIRTGCCRTRHAARGGNC